MSDKLCYYSVTIGWRVTPTADDILHEYCDLLEAYGLDVADVTLYMTHSLIEICPELEKEGNHGMLVSDAYKYAFCFEFVLPDWRNT